MEQKLKYARTTTIIAAALVIACALVIAPLAAFGDGDERAVAANSAVQEALEVREDVEQVNELAREDAPAAVGSRCDHTLDVEGIGDTCVAGNGLLRVEQADGRSHTIHGLDAPPVGASAFTPASQAAVNGASVDDIRCAGPTEPHYVLVYARPGDVASRYNTIAPQLRTELYKVSAFIDSETRAVDPAASKQLPVRCDGSTPVVQQATLSGLTNGTANFGQVVDGLRALGYQFNGNGDGLQRFIVYYDSASPSGAAGTGHVFTADSRGDESNQNNNGGLYAIEYKFADGGGVPHWEVLIHEVLHTMGAVTSAAPNTTGGAAGHCNDGLDVMCYSDGGAASNYNPSVCATKVLDCGRNDYFNPSPPAGSHLATHWNSAATYNRFLHHAAAGDQSAPTQVVGLVQTGASNATIGVAWSPSSDNSGSASYTVSVRTPGGDWRNTATTSRRTATITGLSPMTEYEVGVTARDTAGNTTERTTIPAATNDQADDTAPGAPSGVAVRQTSGRVTFSWNEAGDNVGVADYELRRLTVSTTNPLRRVPRSAGTTPETTISIATTGLTPGVRYEYEVVARDDAANISTGALARVTITKDLVRPTAPGRLRAATRTSSSVTLAWNPSRDNVGVRSYVISQKVRTRWVRLKTLPANGRMLRIVGLHSRTTYTFRVVAIDRAGNQSLAGRGLTTRTR